MGNPPTKDKPKRLDFWLTTQAADILDLCEGSKADFVNRAIVAYWDITRGGMVTYPQKNLEPKLIFDGVDDLIIINAWPLKHPGDQRWVRPLKVAADATFGLKPYAFLYHKVRNGEQPILIPRAMESQWQLFLAGQNCQIESRIVVAPGAYIDIDDKLNFVIELINERGHDLLRKTVVWMPEK